MRQKSGTRKEPAEKVVRDIRRATRKQYSAEEKIRIVLRGLRGEDSIADLSACLAGAPFRDDAAAIEFYLQMQDRAKGEVAVVDMPNRLRLGFVDLQLPVDGVVSERHRSPHPHALLLRGGRSCRV